MTYVVDEKNDGTLNARDLEVKSVTVKSSKAVNKPIQGDDAPPSPQGGLVPVE